MRQRVMIAIAIACRPQLLIADEPTTALDVTIQAQILELLRDLRRELGMSVLLISHDLGVIAEFAQRVVVMYAGRVVEQAPVSQLFRQPVHPYTAGLIAAVPKLDGDARRLATIPGRVPGPQEDIPGCRFSPRCALVEDNCRHQPPPSLQAVSELQSARCPPRVAALGDGHG
jgi:peptide/nickel transport system ATP-binding protein